MVDSYTAAIFDFATLRRDLRFREQYPEVQKALVCVESDLVADVLYGAAAHYCPDGNAMLFCYYSAEQTGARQEQTRAVQGTRRERFGSIGILPQSDYLNMPESARETFGQFTIGQLMERAYGQNIDWDGLPHFELPRPDRGA